MSVENSTKTGVYCWRNTVNGKVYVGSAAKSIKYRQRKHRESLRSRRHHNKHLQHAWDHYGEAAFVFEILESCPPERCIEREQWWIDFTKAAEQEFGYNINPTAGSMLGVTLSAEHKAAILAANKGRKMPPQVLAALVAANTGAKRSEESRRRMSVAHKGKKLTPEHAAKIKAATTGKKRSVASRLRMSIARKGIPLTAEHRAKLSKAAQERSPESRANIADAARRRSARKRLAVQREMW